MSCGAGDAGEALERPSCSPSPQNAIAPGPRGHDRGVVPGVLVKDL